MTDLSQDSFRWNLTDTGTATQTAPAPMGTRIVRSSVYMSVFMFNVLAWYALIMLLA